MEESMRSRGIVALATGVVMAMASSVSALAAEPTVIVHNWYGLMLELVRHTATYSPPAAARTFGYVGVSVYESVASGSDDLVTLAGQVNGLAALPEREPGQTYDSGVVLHTVLADTVAYYFSNTGPTGLRSIGRAQEKWRALAVDGIDADVVERSEAYGHAVSAHIIEWSLTDGGAAIANLGFPVDYELPKGEGKWVPTSFIGLQQAPLLPEWGSNRPFAMPSGSTCALPPPPEYSTDPASDFYKEALEVYETGNSVTDEQRAIARFWSDDPMLSTTPPGHWMSIALQVLDATDASIEESVDLLARLGIVAADAFIGCWDAKYHYNLVRPITYIRQHIDPKWEPVLNTPPFPEYPSGHSTASSAAATVFTAFLGDDFAFEDTTGGKDGLSKRTFSSFEAAAEEAGISRLYGGIHFRAAIESGLDQGRCIAAYAVALKTRK
jgi:hypothetical protein